MATLAISLLPSSSTTGNLIYTAGIHVLSVTLLCIIVMEYRNQTFKLPGTIAGDGDPQPNLILGQGFIVQTSWAIRMTMPRTSEEEY